MAKPCGCGKSKTTALDEQEDNEAARRLARARQERRLKQVEKVRAAKAAKRRG